MSRLPRLALGTIQPEADTTPMLWGLVELLKRGGYQVQLYRDQACFDCGEDGPDICGQDTRYLDSWLMSPSLCRESFAFGSRGSDLALVAGRYLASPGEQAFSPAGGELSSLARWLHLPRLAIVDVVELDHCRIPPRPAAAEAILLDRVAPADYPRWQTTLEALWGVPVLGSLPELPRLRSVALGARDANLTRCHVCRTLGDHLARTTQLSRLLDIATAASELPVEHVVFQSGHKLAGQTVAVAYDEALRAYFPDVLDLLELHGAHVVDFSPLRDEGLPPKTDIVYLGCGQPQYYAAELMRNQCMLLALRNHAVRGGRIYAEAGGLAYLGQEIQLPGGEVLPMAGVWPAATVFEPRTAPRPVEVTLQRDHWLGRAGMTLRGYENSRWRMDASRGLEVIARSASGQPMLAGQGRVVVSQAHINFAAQADFLECFTSAPAGAPSELPGRRR